MATTFPNFAASAVSLVPLPPTPMQAKFGRSLAPFSCAAPAALPPTQTPTPARVEVFRKSRRLLLLLIGLALLLRKDAPAPRRDGSSLSRLYVPAWLPCFLSG